MSSLTELLLDCNEITSLPLSIGRLTELQVFCSQVFVVPTTNYQELAFVLFCIRTLSCVAALQILNLDGNRLSVLPPEVSLENSENCGIGHKALGLTIYHICWSLTNSLA
jgi:Leucine-rich repeat (LRR) protein